MTKNKHKTLEANLKTFSNNFTSFVSPRKHTVQSHFIMQYLFQVLRYNLTLTKLLMDKEITKTRFS